MTVTVNGGNVQVGDHNEQVIRHGAPIVSRKPYDPHGSAFAFVGNAGTRYRPLGDRVVVRSAPLPDRIGSIIVPDSVKERFKHDVRRGTVVAMGPGMPTVRGNRWPMPDVKAGDIVLFFPDGAVKISIDSEELLSLRDDFVFAVAGGTGSPPACPPLEKP